MTTRRHLTCIAMTALLLAWAGAAQAAATRDEITREALLRGYTTADAEARYKALQNRSITASTPAANAIASGLGVLAANAQRRMDEDSRNNERMWLLLEADLDVPMETRGELEALQALLDAHVDPQDYNIAARRRMVQFALHQRRHAQHFFPSSNPARAAEILRRNAYSAQHFYPWAALTLAKLYLTGRGVPRDEGEALRLVSLCETARPGNFPKKEAIPGDIVACLLLKARMHRNGWGAPPDEAAAGAAERAAESAYASATRRRLTAAELAPLFR
ncbi:hypothetical protein ACG02S_11195 [Roseateles sp. DC23W]|uniref:Alginate lyase n=1 Tax=Pelomonas dachongensis TaxID=3299029 RepID=A0ABW7ELU2_9BURK